MKELLRLRFRGGLNILSAFDLSLESRTRHTIHVSNINCAARVLDHPKFYRMLS
ncbi:hypothetical protein ANAPRD1_00021 [Anaplasma phagocytophilum]|nr:hypothetical protein ANAPRD1_00021 [Anaplasma phagocytophilum]SCV65398.1 hypothetical protein ANAPH1_00804 [Anaplasma phagocytophilum]